MKIQQNTAIVLASASPRRQALLQSASISFSVEVSHVCEEIDCGSADLPLLLAQRKAKAVQSVSQAERVVLAADTVVVIDNQLLGKPKSQEDARHMLNLLSAKTHSVITAYCLLCPPGMAIDRIARSVETKVTFGAIDAAWIESYLQEDEYKDKAGSYAIQGYAGALIEKITGSYTNVMGLPLYEVLQDLRSLDVIRYV